MESADLADLIARALHAAGVRIIFGVPGGGNNLDIVGAAEAHGIRFVLTHTEAAAGYMASVYADLEYVVAPFVVTRGPGAASAVNAVAHAWLDRKPVMILSDVVSSADAPRISHQRLDQQLLFTSVTKWSGTVGGHVDADAVVERAIAIAQRQRPGPVHLNVDPTAGTCAPDDEVAADPTDRGALDRAVSMLRESRRPVLVVGVGAKRLAEPIRDLVRGTGIPVLQTYAAKGLVPDSGQNAAGLFTGAAMEAPILNAADLILAIGLDSVELIPNSWPYAAPVVALAEWTDDAGYFPVKLSLIGSLPEMIKALPSPLPSDWPQNVASAHRKAVANALLSLPDDIGAASGIAPAEVVRSVRQAAPSGSVATVDAGAHMLAVMPLWGVQEPGEILISSGLATMGFALPAAISAALVRPERRIYCFTGDGGLGMALAELETLARLRLPVTVVVFNDSTLSLIKVKQRPSGQGGQSAVTYKESNFAAIAQGFGVRSKRVSTERELALALEGTASETAPLLIDVTVDASSYRHIMRISRGA